MELRLIRPFLLLVFLMLATLAHPDAGRAAEPEAQSGTAPGEPSCYQGICEHRLENGLRVLLFPDPSQAQMLVNMTYLVGSKHENYGETGMAHLLEHLMFKGTPSIPNLDQEADRRGFSWNGTTSVDRTNYYDVFDANAEYLEFALQMEADRMVNSFIAKRDLDSEMTVVRNEMEQGETQPFQVAIKTLLGMAYQWHNYGKSTIGARSDVENVPIENLQRFYRTWYQPDNAVLLVAGPIDSEATLSMVQRYFGAIPKPSRVLPNLYTEEPPQDGERLATVSRPGTASLLLGGYHLPPVAHPDSVAAEIALDVLGDSTTGRLRAALVETGLAAAAGGSSFLNSERGMGLIYAQLTQDQDMAKAELALLRTAESFAQNPVTKAEFERARQSYANALKQQLDSVAGLGLALSEYIAAGDWRLFFWTQAALDRLSLADVNRVAKRYWIASNRSLVRFVPGKVDKVTIPAAVPVAELVATLPPDPGSQILAAFPNDPGAIAQRVEQIELRPGLRVLLIPKPSRNQAVRLSAIMRIGDLASLQGQASATAAIAGMLSRGAGELDRVAFEDALNQAESGLIFGRAGSDRLLIGGRSTRKHLSRLLKLAALALKAPRFDAGEFSQWRSQSTAGLERAIDDPQSRAGNAYGLLTSPYGPEHPLAARDFASQEKALEALTLAQVKALHAQLYGASDLTIALVGDFDREQTLKQLRADFMPWQAKLKPLTLVHRVATEPAQQVLIDLKEKANAVLVAGGEFSLRATDADFPALTMADYMLGAGGMSSRLMSRIRQQEGLSYGVSSSLQANPDFPVANWSVLAIAAPENVNAVEAILFEELARFVASGVNDAELATAKQGWLKARRVQLADDGAIAEVLTELAFGARSLKDDVQLEAQVDALTANQVNAAIKRWLQPTMWHRVKAGDSKKFVD